MLLVYLMLLSTVSYGMERNVKMYERYSLSDMGLGFRRLKKRVLVEYKDIKIPASLKDDLVKRALAEGMSEIQYVDILLGEIIEGLNFSKKVWKKHKQD